MEAPTLKPSEIAKAVDMKSLLRMIGESNPVENLSSNVVKAIKKKLVELYGVTCTFEDNARLQVIEDLRVLAREYKLMPDVGSEEGADTNEPEDKKGTKKKKKKKAKKSDEKLGKASAPEEGNIKEANMEDTPVRRKKRKAPPSPGCPPPTPR